LGTFGGAAITTGTSTTERIFCAISSGVSRRPESAAETVIWITQSTLPRASCRATYSTPRSYSATPSGVTELMRIVAMTGCTPSGMSLPNSSREIPEGDLNWPGFSPLLPQESSVLPLWSRTSIRFASVSAM